MKLKRRVLSIILAALTAMLMLGGCSGTETASSGDTSSAAAERKAEREKKRNERKKEREAAEAEKASEKKTENSEPEVTYVYSENQVDGYPTTIGAYKFKEVVEAETDGRIKIDVRINAEVGPESDVVKMLVDGDEYEGNRVAFLTSSLGPLVTASGYEKLNVVQLPYLYRDRAHMRDVLYSDIGEVFLNELADDDTGLRGLAWYDAGARSFYNSKKEIKSADDLEGLTIRAQKNDLMVRMMELLGINPVTSAYDQVVPLLESGEIDGAENNWPSYVSQEHYKYAPYYCTDGHVRIPDLMIMSDDVWNELSVSDQDIIKKAALLASETEWDEWEKQEKAYEEQARKEGCIVTEIKDTSSFREKVEPIYEEFAADYMDVVKEIQEYGK